jgi:hypothetical protein
MASNINPNNITTTFPIAGQDNDSQGFRDNFNNIKTNLTTTKTELEDLQSKVVLKSALTGTTLANDGAGSVIEDHELKDMAFTSVNKGTLTGAVAIDYSAGHFQHVQSSGTLTPSFTNWPATTKYGHLTIEFNITNTAHKVTLPTQCTLGISELADYSTSTRNISFATAGKYRFKFSTIDAGTTVAIEDLNRSPNVVHGDTLQIQQTASAKSGVGAAGDKAGMIAVDGDSIYVANASYDGSTAVWKKVDIHADEATSNRLLRNGGNAITGNILPGTTNTRSLGSASKKMANVHSTAFTGGLVGTVTGSIQALSGAGAVNLTTLITQVTTTSAQALTLANGTNGQIKIISMVADGGDGTLTPATFVNGTTITFNDVGDSVQLLYNTTGGWVLLSNQGCTIA